MIFILLVNMGNMSRWWGVGFEVLTQTLRALCSQVRLCSMDRGIDLLAQAVLMSDVLIDLLLEIISVSKKREFTCSATACNGHAANVWNTYTIAVHVHTIMWYAS